jgi:hypothetical protein
MLAILAYTFAITMSALFSPYTSIFESYHCRMWLGHVLLFVILVTSAKTDRDLKVVIAGLIVVYFMYIAHSYWNFLGGRMLVAMGTERLEGSGGRDPNFFATGIVCTLPLLVPLIASCKKKWHYLFVLGYLLLAVRVVILSGSRGAFVALVVLAILPCLFSRHRFKLLPVVLIAFPLLWFSMPDQYKDRIRTLWDPTINKSANASAGTRLTGESNLGGIQVWIQHPFVGCGPGAFAPATGGVASHNLPSQVYGELGTVGAVAFLFLLTCFGINHYNIWKNYKYLQEKKLGKEGLYYWRVSIAVMYGVAVLFVKGLSLHDAFDMFWVWFAAFQALAAMFMQEKVTATMQGKLLPSQPTVAKTRRA